MPNKDGRGPNGKGSKTGRQEGNCEGANPIARGKGKGCQGHGRKNHHRCN